MSALNSRWKPWAVNRAGFGLGLLWVWRDEQANPRVFRIPIAESFSSNEVTAWNVSAGPKGSWARPISEMSEAVKPAEKIESIASTW